MMLHSAVKDAYENTGSSTVLDLPEGERAEMQAKLDKVKLYQQNITRRKGRMKAVYIQHWDTPPLGKPMEQHHADILKMQRKVDAEIANLTAEVELLQEEIANRFRELKKEESYDYITMENLLLMAGTSKTPDAVSVDDQTNYQGGEFNPELTTRTETGNGTWRVDNNVSSTMKAKGDLLVEMFDMSMTNLERENLRKLEQQFIDWTVAKSEFHNVSTQKSAVDAALETVQGKIHALGVSLESIKIYDLELLSLEDDEMRRIADIKEEFESLAADWLQLATYHCCDIIQGNTVECTDATKHLMDPINNVFPGALKAPDPGRDCVRRLL